MLTRLKVSGFKNLVDVDVRFGPFTCIAGTNGVGKSNLFDAIRFLAACADTTLLEAALSVRAEGTRASDVRGLFTRHGAGFADTMSFEAEMIVPPRALDDFGQEGEAKTTFLRYRLELRHRDLSSRPGFLPGELEIVSEALDHVKKGELSRHILFPSSRAWRDTAVVGACRSDLISTFPRQDGHVVKLHQDGRHGRPSEHAAATLPRTVLSSGSANESPTVLCARREMASWTLLQLEPAVLRNPSELREATTIGANGAHLAAALFHLATTARADGAAPDADAVYCQVANRLSELIGGVDSVAVDHDPKRELLTVKLREMSGAELPARALSDGTLRFLALSVVELDSRGSGVICMEEPENGIHPARIPAMIRLLRDIAVDADEPVGADNPLRQVVVNTHSPVVVAEVPDDCLLMAVAGAAGGLVNPASSVQLLPLAGTWRQTAAGGGQSVPKGELLAYLNPAGAYPRPVAGTTDGRSRSPRVAERDDLQLLLPWGAGA